MSDRFLHQFCLDEDGPVTEVWTLIMHLICGERIRYRSKIGDI